MGASCLSALEDAPRGPHRCGLVMGSACPLSHSIDRRADRIDAGGLQVGRTPPRPPLGVNKSECCGVLAIRSRAGERIDGDLK